MFLRKQAFLLTERKYTGKTEAYIFQNIKIRLSQNIFATVLGMQEEKLVGTSPPAFLIKEYI